MEQLHQLQFDPGAVNMSYHDCTDCPIFASAEESQAHKMMMEEIDKKIEDRRPTITKQLTNATRMQPCSNSLANALSQHAEDQDSSMDEDDEDGEVQNQLMRRMMQHSSNSLANALSQPAEDQYSSMDEDDEGGEVQNHPKKIDCDFCEKKLAPSSLNRHKKDKHNTATLFGCSICHKNFQRKSMLDNHYLEKHVVSTIPILQCESCEYRTHNKYYLSDHVKRQHVGEKSSSSFVCSKCFKRKHNEYLLKKHMQQHIESVCMICQKKFQSNKNLKRHTVVHEIKRCEKDREIGVECGKNFQSKKDLKNPQKRHKKVNEIDALA